jgi:transaldolase
MTTSNSTALSSGRTTVRRSSEGLPGRRRKAVSAPAAFLRVLAEKLRDAGVPWMLTGSAASSYYGEPRATNDLDLDYLRRQAREHTTNPTLMRKAGIADYRAFAHDVLSVIRDRPISFEVFSDEFGEMESQAKEIASWGSNVYVKIPVTNTRGVPAYDLIRRLSAAGVKVNVTALMTLGQVRDVSAALAGGQPSCISVFAGRIADTGRDPVPLMAAAVEMIRPHPTQELIWASPRELLNIFQADAVGCHIITVTNDVLRKLGGVGKDLDVFSLETVKMFFDDGRAAGFKL